MLGTNPLQADRALDRAKISISINFDGFFQGRQIALTLNVDNPGIYRGAIVEDGCFQLPEPERFHEISILATGCNDVTTLETAIKNTF